MKHVKAFLQSKKGLILVFAAAAILILAGGIGGTRAALSVYSEQYNSRLQTSDIGISLYENEILAAQRDYDPDAGNYSWKESGTGLLCQKLIGRYAARTANRTAGSMLATLSLFPQTRLTPTQKIRTEPTSDR